MAELVDALGLGPSGSNPVKVQVLSPVPLIKKEDMKLSKIILPTIEELKEVFFQGSLKGWCSGKAKKTESPDLSGWKIITIPVGEFLYIDRYAIGLDGHSFGFIEIKRDENLFWAMRFGGQYTEEASGVVKQALLNIYNKREFLGGRGPRFFKSSSIMYENLVRNGGSFEKFRGFEEVLDQDNIISLGHHWYNGGCMFSPK